MLIAEPEKQKSQGCGWYNASYSAPNGITK